ncbi:MAG: pyridoxamine 5'-phosphate oxidase [Pyrinomonadaceae bacterium]
MLGKELASIRREYSLKELTRSSVDADPVAQFGVWMQEALDSQLTEPTAMMLATVDAECRPSTRIVLLKEFGERGFVFFTNYESKKSRDLAGNPHCSLSFFWPELERQVHIAGTAAKIAAEESAAYFRTRPVASQIGAWASRQSSVIASREVLERWFAELEEKFRDQEVPLPDFWGGWNVTPSKFEFWQGRQSRLHDRIMYELKGGGWEICRLSP